MAHCPECGTDGAYMGFNAIECGNPACKHYVPAVEEKNEEDDDQVSYVGSILISEDETKKVVGSVDLDV